MTKKQAIAKVKNSGDWTEKEAISIVENEIKRNPDYLEEEGAPEEIFYPTREYSDESSPINRPFFHQYHEGREPEEFDPEEFIKEIEEESKFDTSEFDPELHNVDAWFGGEPKEETKEERLERQIDRYNSMRDHVFDSDEGYMQGQDPESRTRQVENQELTQMVEALQRQAMQQGNVGATVNMPFDPNSVPSNQGFPMTPAGPNPIIQALRNQNQMGRPGLDVNSLRPGTNAPIMQRGVSPLMGIGGGNQSWGAGTMNRGWNPYA
jgi:hypothetical protein